MKKILLIGILGFLLSSCNDDKLQETTLLNEVIKTHDKLMVDDGVIMKNKAQLKEIAKADTSAATKDSVVFYSSMLDNADMMMMNWMNKFSPDFSGKSHEQILSYLHTQKTQIMKLDTQINTAVAASNKYILKSKTK